MDVRAIVAAGAPAAVRRSAAALARFLAPALAGRRRDRVRRLRREQTRFLATVCHELRTPLSGVLGMADLLRRSGLSPEQAGYVEAIRSSGAGMIAIVDQMLDCARLEEGRVSLTVEPVDLRRLVDGVVELLAPGAETRGVTIAASVGPSTPRVVRADATRLRRVLLNLAGNAVKFTERGGACVAVERGDGDLIQFRVIDTGPGVAPGRREAIFEAFERGEDASIGGVEGAGLGLSISRRLVGHMGGTLTLEDNPCGGSIFSFAIPAPACDEAAEAWLAAVAAPARRDVPVACGRDTAALSPPRRALVAEDSDINALIAEKALRRLGFEPVRARDGDEAVRLACPRRPEAPPFDLILMDLRMPALDGFEATRRLRRQEREAGARPTPIVALSAGDLGVGTPGQESDFDAILAKPFDQDDLAAAVDRLRPTNGAPRHCLSRAS